MLEDDEDLREAIQELLEEDGFHVIAAGDGEDALEHAGGPSFEVAIFDIKLPGIDGLEALSEIKSQNPELMSIVITGYATEQDTIRALRLGVGDYLKKPFSMNQLLESVSRLAKSVLERRDLKKKEQSALKLMTWSLELGVGSVDLSSSIQNRLSMVRKLELVANRAGHNARAAQHLKASLLYLLLKEASENHHWDQFDLLSELLPASVVAESEAISNYEGEFSTSLLPLGALTYRALTEPDLESQLSDFLATAVAQEGLTQEEQRSYLSLARTLLASGQSAPAVAALKKAVTGQATLDSGLALLELAQVEHNQGRSNEAKSLLRQSLKLTTSLGPQASAVLAVEAGMTSLSMGFADGSKVLQSVLPSLTRLRMTALEKLAQLVLAILPEAQTTPPQDLEVDANFLRHQEWLLPRLAAYRGDEAAEAIIFDLLSKLARETPRQMARLLLASLDESFVERMLGTIASWNLSAYQELLDGLASRKDWPGVQKMANAILAKERRSELPTLRFFSFGSFEVWLGAERVSEQSYRTVRSRFLLACLASRGGRPILQETLVEQFWPGVAPKNGRKNLSQVLSDARKALYDGGFPTSVEPIVRRHDTIMLHENIVYWHDLDRFEDLHQLSRSTLQRGDKLEAYQLMREAATLARGSYLEDCPMDWVEVRARSIERATVELYESLGQCCFDLQLFPEAVEMCENLLRVDPCNQKAHLLAMESHIKHERPSLALKHFERAELALKTELGIEPSIELVKAFHQAKLLLS